MSDPKKFYMNYYKPLIGAKIIDTTIKVEDDFGADQFWPQITVEKDGQQFVLEVSRDEEGNGPGFLFGLPTPK